MVESSKSNPHIIARVLNPTDAECSNECFAGLTYSSRRVVSPSQCYSHNRLLLFGYILRHSDALEYQASSMPSGAYCFIAGPNRLGRPRLRWAESCVAEAANRIDYLLSDSAPLHTDIHSSHFAVPSTQEVLNHHSAQSVVGWKILSCTVGLENLPFQGITGLDSYISLSVLISRNSK